MPVCGQKETDYLQRIVDCHSSGVLSRAQFSIEGRTYPNGDIAVPGSGVTVSIAAGLTNRLTIGIGYGADGVIGLNRYRFNPHIGALFKYRIVEESFYMPAIALGYDHQGFGGIDGSYNGYQYKSAGIFCAAGKNILLFTKVRLGVHAGLNYSFEEYPEIKWPNCYTGVDAGFIDELSVAVEYDAALNTRDPGGNSLDVRYDGPMFGFLNVGIRWYPVPTLCVELCLKDLLKNKTDNRGSRIGWGRELRLMYIGNLF
jgi:hypothetical protein